MACPLCKLRKARRSCPALGCQICAVCCGTKRLIEIRCPGSCPYLASAREHPPAAALRQHQRDLEGLARMVRDFNERQSRLFFVVATFLLRYEPPELHSILDGDIQEAARAVASTFETASRGVIYEHRPVSRPAEQLAGALKAALIEAGSHGGSAYERDAAVVLRRMADAADELGAGGDSRPRALVELLGRIINKAGGETEGGEDAREAPRLIVPEGYT